MKDIAIPYAPPIVSRPFVTPHTTPPQGQNFQAYLKDALGEVNELDEKADHEIEKFVGEGTGDFQEVMISMEKADIAFSLTMQIRNKLLESYQEVMRMQV